jgi:hypothetical protein
MSFAQGVRVMRRVAPALSYACYDRPGTTRNRLIGGYRLRRMPHRRCRVADHVPPRPSVVTGPAAE